MRRPIARTRTTARHFALSFVKVLCSHPAVLIQIKQLFLTADIQERKRRNFFMCAYFQCGSDVIPISHGVFFQGVYLFAIRVKGAFLSFLCRRFRVPFFWSCTETSGYF